MTPVLIFECNDQLWTTSQEIARLFGRRHGTVLRSIRSLNCSEEFRRNNFVLTSCLDAQGRKSTLGFISRTGLAILITGLNKRTCAAMVTFLKAFKTASLRNQDPCHLTGTTQ